MHTPADFPTARALISFLRELRVPIPPVISALEIASFQWSGSTDLVTKYLYRASLVGTYVLALWFTYPSIPRLFASFFVSVVFLWTTTLIHPLNPQVYDMLLPFFIFLFLALMSSVPLLLPRRSVLALIFSFWSGFFLAMAELDRP